MRNMQYTLREMIITHTYTYNINNDEKTVTR